MSGTCGGSHTLARRATPGGDGSQPEAQGSWTRSGWLGGRAQIQGSAA